MLSDRDAAARAYERAGDAFMEAGDYARATNDYLIAANALRHQSASRALALFERVLALFGSDNPLSTEQRASILYSRAELLFARGELEAALASAHEAVTLRTPLTGIDEQKASSMYLAAQIADTLGATEAAKRFHEDAEQLAATFVGHAATRRRFVAACAGDATVDLETLRNEAITEGDAQLEALCDIYSAIESPLPFEERIAVADRARARIDQAQLADRDKELVALAFAELYRGHGDDARALNWYLRLLDVSPEHEIGARQAVRLLFKLQRWSEAVRILEMQVSLYGESIRLLLPLSEALIACGRPHDAVDRIVKAQELASSERDSDRVFTLLKKANAAAKTVPPPSPAARQQAATLSDLEETLRAFKQHVEAQRRMEFWKRKKPKEKTRGSAPKPAADGDPDQHQWRSGPEATAKSLLWSYLEGRLQNVEILDEIKAGPGRIDLYVRFEGGERVVIELKMLGAGYSSTYAESGFDQLCTYMNSHTTSIGYLIAFDARSRDQAKALTRAPEARDKVIYVTHVDVRPTVPKTTKPKRPRRPKD